MATKLSKKLLVVALLGVMGLTACDDDISSYPKDGEILPASQGQKIYNNELSEIYEGIRDGSLASDVLDKLLYEYANTIFGRYTTVAEGAPSYSTNDAEDADTLKAVVESGDQAKMEEYVGSHKAFWPGATIPEDPTEKAAQLPTAVAKLKAIYKTVEDRIAEALYSKISGGGYSEHNIFSERKFLASLLFDGKKVADFRTNEVKENKVDEGDVMLYEDILYPEVEGKDVFTKETGSTVKANKYILHKEYYYSPTNTYAIASNIESIYRDLLTEQYITDESYTTLGRSYARKVNVLALTVDSDNKSDVPALVNYLVDNVIASKDGDLKLTIADGDRHGEKAVTDLYTNVGKIMRGLPEYFNAAYDRTTATAKDKQDNFPTAVIDDLNHDYGLFGSYKDLTDNTKNAYLTSTAYGSMMKDFLKIKDDLVATDSSIESSFTGSGAYTVAQGKIYKEREIALKSYTTTGWHIKNGGLSSLPETIRNRLFNLSVASALDSDGLIDRNADDYYGYDQEIINNKYVAKVNGAYWLKAETVEEKGSNRDLYFYDSSSSTYYFVQILEAVNPAKLSADGSSRYAAIYNDNELQEDIAREVCEQVAKISSYSGLAKDHWLKEMALEYHDTKIYDYFKSNYPDLFD